MSTQPKMLLVGPLPIAGDVIGGTKVCFSNLVQELSASGSFELEVHNISRAQTGRGRCARAWNNVVALGRLATRLLRAPVPDIVFFNLSAGGMLLSGPLIWSLCKLRRRPLVVRAFGGDLDTFFDRASAPLRWMARHTFLRTDLLLLETRALCARFESEARTGWWPNTRQLAIRSTPARERATRFLFLGQLRREKGIEEALQAATSLPDGATLSVFGPAMPGYDASVAIEQAGCTNGGPLPPERVASVLADHDVLVLPSYHPGEGMPGIVIEAMQIGLPVITTRWRALGELIEHEGNGLLVDPRNPQQLAEAMTRIANDPELFAQLQQGALRIGNRFRPADWNAWLEQQLTALCHEPHASRPLQEVA